jgi:rubrerythrin
LAAHLNERDVADRGEAKKVLRDQILIEGELISLYEKTANEIPNPLVQQMLKMIRHDSQKHIMMLNVIVDFLEGKEIFMQDRRGLADSLKRHLELEEKSIQNGEALLKKEWLQDRKGYKAIIENWVEDEKRHHKFLKELSEKPFTPISSNDFASAFRDEEFFDERYRESKAYWEKNKDIKQ